MHGDEKMERMGVPEAGLESQTLAPMARTSSQFSISNILKASPRLLGRRRSSSSSVTLRTDGSDDRAVFDLVLVPAIGANVYKTWDCNTLNKREHKSVYEDIPNANIFWYSHGQFDGPTDDVLEMYAEHFLNFLLSRVSTPGSTRPLHIAAHSTGGLVVKRAIADSKWEGSQFHDLWKTFFGVTFYSVPHQGSSFLSNLQYPDAVVAFMQYDLTSRIWKKLSLLLDPEDPDLTWLDEEFKKIARHLRYVWTVTETYRTSIKHEHLTEYFTPRSHEVDNKFVVDHKSAILNIDEERKPPITLPASHNNLCMAFSKSTEKWQRYKQELQNMMAQAAYIQSGDSLHHQLREEIGVELHVVHGVPQETYGSQSEDNTESGWESGDTSSTKKKGKRNKIKRKTKRKKKSIASVQSREDRAGSLSAVTSPQDLTRIPTFQELRVRSFEPTLEQFLRDGPEICFDNLRGADDESQEHAIADFASPSIVVQNVDETDSKHTSAGPKSIKTMQDFTRFRDRLYCWIHIPLNHPGWTIEAVDSLVRDMAEKTEHIQRIQEHIRHPAENLYHFEVPHSRRMRSTARWMSNEHLLVHMPYLHWDTLRGIDSRANIVAHSRGIRKRRQTSKGPPKHVSEGSVEKRLLWHCSYHSRKTEQLHQRRSLDQFGHPSLPSTKERDRDQIIQKFARKRKRKEALAAEDENVFAVEEEEFEVPLGPVDASDKALMVDQMWLYIVDDRTVITCFPPRDDSGTAEQQSPGDLRTVIYDELTAEPKFSSQFQNATEFALFAITSALKVIPEHVQEDEDLHYLPIFDQYISELTEDQNKSYKSFRENQQKRTENQIPRKKKVKRSKEEEDNDVLATIQDLKNFTELKDVDDELEIIHQVLSQQLDVLNDISNNDEGSPLQDSNPRHANALIILREGKRVVENNLKEVERLNGRCEKAHSAYEHLLDLRDKQASIYEARRAGQRARIAEDQNRSIIVFTIITIVFQPLAFFTSFFGMNVSFRDRPGELLSLHHVGIIMGPVSTAVIAMTLLLAFSWHIRRFVVTYLRDPILNCWRNLKSLLASLMLPGQTLQRQTTYGEDTRATDLPNGRVVRAESEPTHVRKSHLRSNSSTKTGRRRLVQSC